MTQCGGCGALFGHLDTKTQEVVGLLEEPLEHRIQCPVEDTVDYFCTFKHP